ncbi:PilC/PilY family type IV pilus protein, partial [Acinetobacter baumannii]
DADMGYVLGAPLVRKGNNGKTLVMVGNGAESPNGKAVLYIYVLDSNGSVPNNGVIALVADAGSGNGLAEPRAADIDND